MIRLRACRVYMCPSVQLLSSLSSQWLGLACSRRFVSQWRRGRGGGRGGSCRPSLNFSLSEYCLPYLGLEIPYFWGNLGERLKVWAPISPVVNSQLYVGNCHFLPRPTPNFLAHDAADLFRVLSFDFWTVNLHTDHSGPGERSRNLWFFHTFLLLPAEATAVLFSTSVLSFFLC